MSNSYKKTAAPNILLTLLGFLSWTLLIGFIFATEIFCDIAGKKSDYEKIETYSPLVISRVYSKSGKKIAQFAKENRIIVQYTEIPQNLIDAFLAAEDKNFFLHQGVDVQRLGIAIIQTIYNLLNHRRAVGASTITQQVVRNVLIDNSRSIDRKIREIVLAYRITQIYPKEKILEIYLNQIFLGNGSYGVAAAAQNYFGKKLDELDIAENAVLASLPKAPSQLNPFQHPEKMLRRRNWVIQRMEEDKFISIEDAEKAKRSPLILANEKSDDSNNGNIFNKSYVDAVKRELIDLFGEEEIYTKGMTVITNIDLILQEKIFSAFVEQLHEYDRRHGWKGPITHIKIGNDINHEITDKKQEKKFFKKNKETKKIKDDKNLKNKNKIDTKFKDSKKNYKIINWLPKLITVPRPDNALDTQILAVVLDLLPKQAVIGFDNGEISSIKLTDMSWARKRLPRQNVGTTIKKPSDILSIGDVILVRGKNTPLLGENIKYCPGNNKKKEKICSFAQYHWQLDQIPDANGGAVAMEPYTGNVLALVGGHPSKNDYFNRVTQAMRQPGSSFKPIVHMVALENNMHPYTPIKDEPLVVDMGATGGGVWSPKNYTKNFLGEITLGEALAKSRNLPTVRLTLAFGVPRIMEMAKRFSIYDKNKKYYEREYALALGTGETTLMNMTNAYNSIASHGFMTKPKLIALVYDSKGNILYQQNKVECENCYPENDDSNNQNHDQSSSTEQEITVPKVLIPGIRLISYKTYHHINSMLLDTVKWGTARGLNTTRPFAGKTGSTNSSLDAWFIGYGAQFTVGIYVGFDAPKTLGAKEYGATISLPACKEILSKIEGIYPYIHLSQSPSSTEIYQNQSAIPTKNQQRYKDIEWHYINQT